MDDLNDGTYHVKVCVDMSAIVRLIVNMDKDLQGSSGELPAMQVQHTHSPAMAFPFFPLSESLCSFLSFINAQLCFLKKGEAAYTKPPGPSIPPLPKLGEPASAKDVAKEKAKDEKVAKEEKEKMSKDEKATKVPKEFKEAKDKAAKDEEETKEQDDSSKDDVKAEDGSEEAAKDESGKHKSAKKATKKASKEPSKDESVEVASDAKAADGDASGSADADAAPDTDAGNGKPKAKKA